LLHQTTQKSDGSSLADISWDPGELMDGEAFRALGYDAAGNALGSTMRDRQRNDDPLQHGAGPLLELPGR